MSESAHIATITVQSLLVILNIAGNSLVCIIIMKNQEMRYVGGLGKSFVRQMKIASCNVCLVGKQKNSKFQKNPSHSTTSLSPIGLTANEMRCHLYNKIYVYRLLLLHIYYISVIGKISTTDSNMTRIFYISYKRTTMITPLVSQA